MSYQRTGDQAPKTPDPRKCRSVSRADGGSVPLTREECVTRLDETLLPPLSRLVTRLAERYPHVNAKTFSVSVGAVTGFDGHGTGVECLLPATSPDQPDLSRSAF